MCCINGSSRLSKNRQLLSRALKKTAISRKRRHSYRSGQCGHSGLYCNCKNIITEQQTRLPLADRELSSIVHGQYCSLMDPEIFHTSKNCMCMCHEDASPYCQSQNQTPDWFERAGLSTMNIEFVHDSTTIRRLLQRILESRHWYTIRLFSAKYAWL